MADKVDDGLGHVCELEMNGAHRKIEGDDQGRLTELSDSSCARATASALCRRRCNPVCTWLAEKSRADVPILLGEVCRVGHGGAWEVSTHRSVRRSSVW